MIKYLDPLWLPVGVNCSDFLLISSPASSRGWMASKALAGAAEGSGLHTRGASERL